MLIGSRVGVAGAVASGKGGHIDGAVGWEGVGDVVDVGAWDGLRLSGLSVLWAYCSGMLAQEPWRLSF